MNSRRYWKNRLPFLLTNLVCMAALTVFLLVCGNSVSAVVLILIVWALVLLTGLILTYWKRKRQMKKLLDIPRWQVSTTPVCGTLLWHTKSGISFCTFIIHFWLFQTSWKKTVQTLLQKVFCCQSVL